MISITKESLELTQKISDEIKNKTFHHHYHILYDIVNQYPFEYNVVYVEVGCFAGGSACLTLQRKNTTVVSIDIGNPIDQSVVENNVSKLNIHNNKYTYIKGNSHHKETYNRLIKCVDEIDVLFIDGDHSYEGVIKDFEMYSVLVKKGGYIVFDDYNDNQHSPEVHKAVSQILQQIMKDYEIIGSVDNIYGARPYTKKEGNCFTIRKK